MMTAAKLYRVILPVSDIELAAKFYADVFRTDGERVSPGRHYFDCGGVTLACYDPAADGDDPGEGWLHHEKQFLYFSVSDLESYRDRVNSAGGHVLSEIESMPWGERVFYAQDPLGSRLSFVDASTLITGTD
jgi:predicted enzyme related to lactoylglutathione lyase